MIREEGAYAPLGKESGESVPCKEGGVGFTEMELRVAKAIHDEALHNNYSGDAIPFPYDNCLIYGDDLGVSAKIDCVAVARAAIRAMREPTREMLEAGDRKISMGSQYQAMIDAATAP